MKNEVVEDVDRQEETVGEENRCRTGRGENTYLMSVKYETVSNTSGAETLDIGNNNLHPANDILEREIVEDKRRRTGRRDFYFISYISFWLSAGSPTSTHVCPSRGRKAKNCIHF